MNTIWAPRGSRTALEVRQRRDRLSVTVALALSPDRRRKSMYFQAQSSNILTTDVVAFVRCLRRHLRRPITLIWVPLAGAPFGRARAGAEHRLLALGRMLAGV